MIVGAWWRPLPPILDGAPAWVVEHTLRRLRRYDPVTLSPYYSELEQAEFDRERYLHVRSTRLDRAVARLPHRIVKPWFGTGERVGLEYIPGVGRWLKQLKPDVIVAHALPSLAWVARRSAPQAKVVFYEHTNHLQDRTPAEWKRLMASADHLIAVSRKTIDCAEARHSRIPIPAHVIPNGVDLQAFHPGNRERWRREVRQELGLGEGPVAVFCGRIQPRKGADHLLHAFKQIRRRIPSAQLLVIGASTHMATEPDPYVRKLHALAEDCGEGAVRFSGYVPSPKLGRILAAGDVGVFPAVQEEGMPLTVLEYAASGMAQVASTVGGIPEVLRHERDALLLPPDRMGQDLEGLLTRVLSDPALSFRMGHAARARVEAEFGWERVARDFERVLDQVVGVEAERALCAA